MQIKPFLIAVLSTLVLAAGGSRDVDPGEGQAGFNLLLVTLDTTRADRLGLYGYELALTPALDGLASRGVVFDQAFTNVPMTLPAHATIMTGLHPPEHGIRINGKERLDLDLPTLAEVLQDRGYQTGAFVASFTLSAGNGLNVGFDVYDEDLSIAHETEEDNQFYVYRSGKLVVDSALGWLAKRDSEQPFFGWVHLFDPHLPYVAHPELADTKFDGRVNYDAEIAFMDAQLARLLSFLEAENLIERTVVVAVGDHGEGLGQHGEPEHGYMLYEETLRVPLIISNPGRIKKGHRVEAVVSLVDLFATILELLEIKDVDERSGRSLVAALHGGPIDSVPAYGETNLPFTTFNWSPIRSLTTPSAKYIRSRRIHYYDRGSDPGEMRNLAPLRANQVTALEMQLQAIEDAMAQGEGEQIRLPPEAVERLEALGYVGEDAGSADTKQIDYRSLPDIEDMIPVVNKYQHARALGREGRHQEQIPLLREILKASPETVSFRRLLGAALMEAGELDEAIENLEQVLEVQPQNSVAHRNLGSIYHDKGDAAKAVHHFSEAVRIDPKDASAHKGLGYFLGREGKTDEAMAHLTLSLEANPKDDQVRFMRANLFETQGKIVEAVADYREILSLVPDSVPALNNLAWILATNADAGIRDGSQAVELAARAARGAGSESPDLLDTLAAAYAEAGRFKEARETARKALRLAVATQRQDLAKTLRARLERYESDQPYHTAPPR